MTNTENFDDCTQVAPKGQFKAGVSFEKEIAETKEFRTIKYMLKKDIHLNRGQFTQQAKKAIDNANSKDAMVLRLLIDRNNIVVIEYAGLITRENIRNACEWIDKLAEEQSLGETR